jgi:AbrB family looped-hinge helix DNA binding protein
MKTVVKVQKRGVVTIPVEVREALEIREGDFLEIDVSKITK